MSEPQSPDNRDFATTRWSLVAAAKLGGASEASGRRALEQLCQAYWYPLYVFVRVRGHSPEDAQDLTQSFFERVVLTGGFDAAEPERGRFRSYLLGAMKHFLANEWHRARAQKRGGGRAIVELDGLEPEARYALEPEASANPEAGFDRVWALETTARAMAALRAEWKARGREELFEALRRGLSGEGDTHAETATRFGMTEGAVKVAAHRLRQRYQTLLRAEVAETLRDPADIDDEMRHLVDALRQR